MSDVFSIKKEQILKLIDYVSIDIPVSGYPKPPFALEITASPDKKISMEIKYHTIVPNHLYDSLKAAKNLATAIRGVVTFMENVDKSQLLKIASNNQREKAAIQEKEKRILENKKRLDTQFSKREANVVMKNLRNHALVSPSQVVSVELRKRGSAETTVVQIKKGFMDKLQFRMNNKRTSADAVRDFIMNEIAQVMFDCEVKSAVGGA